MQFMNVGQYGGRRMIIHETNSDAAKTTSIVMAVIFFLMGAFGALLTMHFYVKPSTKIGGQ